MSSAVAAVQLRSFSQRLQAVVVSCCFFRSALSRFNANFQHYSQITPSTRRIAHKDQHTSHLQRKSQRRNSFTATLSWSILASYGATWFTFVLHRALLALVRTFLCSFRILRHKCSCDTCLRSTTEIADNWRLGGARIAAAEDEVRWIVLLPHFYRTSLSMDR